MGAIDDHTSAEHARHARIASQRIGRDPYRQVYDVHFVKAGGKEIEVITISDASREECSMGAVSVLRVVATAR